jgi:hypothetical protein
MRQNIIARPLAMPRPGITKKPHTIPVWLMGTLYTPPSTTSTLQKNTRNTTAKFIRLIAARRG